MARFRLDKPIDIRVMGAHLQGGAGVDHYVPDAVFWAVRDALLVSGYTLTLSILDSEMVALTLADHFLKGTVPNVADWTTTNVGTGTSTIELPNAGRGRLIVATGVGAVNDRSQIQSLIAPTINNWNRLEAYMLRVSADVHNDTLQTATWGLWDGATTGCRFIQLGTTQVQCRTEVAGVATNTAVNKAITAAGQYRIVARTTSVEFYIDNVLVATHTTNIPTSATLQLRAFMQTLNTGANRRLFCDFAQLQLFPIS